MPFPDLKSITVSLSYGSSKFWALVPRLFSPKFQNAPNKSKLDPRIELDQGYNMPFTDLKLRLRVGIVNKICIVLLQQQQQQNLREKEKQQLKTFWLVCGALPMTGTKLHKFKVNHCRRQRRN